MKITCSPLPVLQYGRLVAGTSREDVRNIFLHVWLFKIQGDLLRNRSATATRAAQTHAASEGFVVIGHPNPTAETLSLNAWLWTVHEHRLTENTRRRGGFRPFTPRQLNDAQENPLNPARVKPTQHYSAPAWTFSDTRFFLASAETHWTCSSDHRNEEVHMVSAAGTWITNPEQRVFSIS